MAAGDILVKVGADITDFSRKMNSSTKTLSNMGQQASKTSKLTATKLAAIGLATVALAKGFGMLKNSIGGAVDRYDTLNQFPRVLETMGFDAADSKKAIDKLSDGIDGLPTALDSVADTAKNIALMTGDLDGAVDTTIALNNAFLASGASTADAERGLKQYTQMLSKGKVDMQSWNTLQETMPVALNKTAEAFGYTGKSAQNDLYAALQSGTVTFDQFNDKVVELNDGVGGFADMAQEGSKGIATSWQNIKTAITKGLADIIGAIDEALGGTGALGDALDKIKGGIKATFDWIVEAIPVVAEVFTVLYNAFATLIGWITQLGESNSGTMDGIYEKISTIFTQVYEFMQEVWGTIRTLWEENGAAILENAKIVFGSILSVVETVFNAALDIIKTVLNIVVPFIKKQLDKITKFWKENGETIMKAVTNCFNFIKGVIDFVMPVIIAIVEGAWNIITAVFEAAIGVVMGLVQVFSGLLSGDFDKIKEGLIKIWESLWDGVKGVVEGAWNLVSGAFGALWDNISGWFTGMKDDAIQWGANMIGGFIDGIKSKAADVAKAASDIVKSAGDFIKFWSPSKKGEGRYITHWGANMIDGFLDGVSSQTNATQKVMAGVIDGMGDVVAKGTKNIMPNLNGSVSMAYTTPNGTHSALSSAVNGSVDVNANGQEALLSNILAQLKANGGTTIELDGRTVGKALTPHISENMARETSRRRRFG